MRRTLWHTLFALVFLGRSALAQEGPQSQTRLTFEKHVRPILKAHCFRCHGKGEKLKGGLDLRLRRLMVQGGDSGPAIELGAPKDSYLWEQIRAGEMPPGKNKLSEKEITLIGRWIAGGAPTLRAEPDTLEEGIAITPEEREYWSFQPIRRPTVPDLGRQDRVRTPIDAFLRVAMNEKGLSFSPDADKSVLLKRAYFDLVGLPPTPEEVARFLADDFADAYQRLIDRLLASPRYGERWGRHWLDVAGYADSEGYTDADTVRKHAYAYRDYVIRSLNGDKPFDRFIQEQLAGDEMVALPYKNLGPDAVEKLVATGFLRMAADGTGTRGVDQDVARNQVVADTIQILSSALLGMTVGCAQCHDHRYDPILQTDYYRLRSILEPAYDWKRWRLPKQRLISLYTDADRENAKKVEAEAAKVAVEKAGKLREYLAAAFKKELESFPADQREALRVAFRTPAQQRTEEQQQLIRSNPKLNIVPGKLYQYDPRAAADLKNYDAKIADIRGKKREERFIRVMTEVPGHVPATYLFHRGDHRQPKQAITPGGLTITASESERLEIPENDPNLPTTGRRLAYARWLTGGKHPLTARVLVNRVWMHHFGRGLVGTPADFGAMGETPTHPELLDWLASEFMQTGWSLKKLHKLIMTSTAYRQSSRIDPRKEAVDEANRLYWRMTVRRLDAEAIRDRVLATSGLLQLKMFGPPVPVKEDSVGQIIVGIDNNTADKQTDDIGDLGSEQFRRSVYIEVRRSRPLTMLNTFDSPRMETNCDRRRSSTTASQALLLMNSKFMLTQARHFADRIHREVGGDLERKVAHAWQLAFARPATDDEIKQSLYFLTLQIEHLKQKHKTTAATSGAAQDEKAAKQKTGPAQQPDHQTQALTNFCQVLLSANEFLYID